MDRRQLLTGACGRSRATNSSASPLREKVSLQVVDWRFNGNNNQQLSSQHSRESENGWSSCASVASHRVIHRVDDRIVVFASYVSHCIAPPFCVKARLGKYRHWSKRSTTRQQHDATTSRWGGRRQKQSCVHSGIIMVACGASQLAPFQK